MESLTLWVLHEGSSEYLLKRVDLLRRAALERSLQFSALDSTTVDHTNLPRLSRGDMLFNCGRGSTLLETLLTIPGISTFRSNSPSLIENGSDTVVFSAAAQREGLPSPRTVYQLPSDPKLLSKYIDYLGGYPVVLKSVGSTLGEGVAICSDQLSMLSMLDLLKVTNREYILREYIPHDRVLRVVTLGNRVLCTLAMEIRERDFRSTISGDYKLFASNPEIDQLALAAAKVSQYEFCGVDIVEHPERGPVIIECNPPSNFGSIRERVGVDVASEVVKYLYEKSLRILST